jgi:hypothetical protein
MRKLPLCRKTGFQKRETVITSLGVNLPTSRIRPSDLGRLAGSPIQPIKWHASDSIWGLDDAWKTRQSPSPGCMRRRKGVDNFHAGFLIHPKRMY